MLVTAYSRKGEKVLLPQAALANPYLADIYTTAKPDVAHLAELEQYAANQAAFNEIATPVAAESKRSNNRVKAQKVEG